MSNISVDFDVLNQRGSPAWFTDTFANIPTAGFVGRMFISKDTFAFYRDTGSGWDLIGGPGIGTLTGSGVVGQVSFFNGTQVITGSNNLFWDNTNNRLGINTATPGAPLDIHATGTNAQFNGTGTSNAYLAFQNAGANKWRIGNTYNAGANSFDIYNNGLTNTPFSISSTTNAITLASNVTTTGAQFVQNALYVGYANGGATALYTNMYGSATGINFGLANGTGGANFIFQTANGYNYTFPATTGTLALTSDLSGYLPLAGGTLTGALNGTSASFSSTASATAFIPTGASVPTNGMYISAANTLNFATNSSQRLTITSDGYVIIGSSATSTGIGVTRFQVAGTSTTAQILATNTSGGFASTYITNADVYMTRLDTSGKLFIGTGPLNGASFNSQMEITSGGNVLINTSTDTGEKLQVTGTAKFSNSVSFAGSVYNYVGSAKFFSQGGLFNYLYSGTTSLIIINQADTANIATINGTTGVYVATSDKNRKKILN